MHCLHICNDLLGSTVHRTLYQELSTLEVKQTVFHPYRGKEKQSFPFIDQVVYSRPLKKWHKILFGAKTNFLYKDIKKNIPLEKVNVVHASNLYSDGALAYKIHQKWGTPYVVAVRATDVFFYMQVRKDLAKKMAAIYRNAAQVVFLTPALKQRFELLAQQNRHLKDIDTTEAHVIPNGLADFWHESRYSSNTDKKQKLLYVGSMLARKNVPLLLAAFSRLRTRFPHLSLTIAGGQQADYQQLEMKAEDKEYIHLKPRLKSQEALRQLYREHDLFAMPSIYETFGLVYLEAISQGLPILYIQNEGVDGLLPKKAGEAAEATEEDIYAKLSLLLESPEEYSPKDVPLDAFRWKEIARQYLDLYQSIQLQS